ncbi:MAG: hypothetical protein EA398_07920 [Deltaproteobacteria bacterium]|nr:MAG: hypothetical protein EA398_07920 [Deltaproteobacteria bacterium]
MKKRLIVTAVAGTVALLLLSPASAEAEGDDSPTAGMIAQAGDAARDGSRTEQRPLDFDMRMREIEDRVGELKDEVFRSRSRLFLLREQVLQDRIGGSRVVINHRDRLGNRYRVVRVLYALNGESVFVANEDTTDFAAIRHHQVHSGSAIAGPQNITAQVWVVGNPLGVFSYMSGYRFTIRNAHSFSVEEGQTAEISVVIESRGGVNTPIDERLVVRFDADFYDTVDGVGDEVAAGQTP